MPEISSIATPPFTMVVRDALQDTRDAAVEADLLFLEAWEMFPSMHPGSVLRANQIRRANPGLAAALDRELQSARRSRPFRIA
ncbi:MAG TPA: hypothetical protein VE690_23445 [Rhodopila sp.]|jgi:hypothetical protein|nr:hypothetical protein [Rhodopila sp.]